jgi:tRNA-modifying protein YgfZ
MTAPYSLPVPIPVGRCDTGDDPALLPSWASLRVTGPDAESFLQGQLSSDVRPQGASWSSYNSPKGRMLAVLRLTRSADAFELRLPQDLLDPVSRRLRMFVLRSKVVLTPSAAASAGAAVAQADRRALIEAGVPVVVPATQDHWVAQMANLDRIGGISFDKGCYTGQEVVARLHYLGNLKKRMFRVQGSGAPPAPGTPIHEGLGDGQSVGDIVDAVDSGGGRFVASAVLQIAHAESSGLRVADAPLDRPAAYPYGS